MCTPRISLSLRVLRVFTGTRFLPRLICFKTGESKWSEEDAVGERWLPYWRSRIAPSRKAVFVFDRFRSERTKHNFELCLFPWTSKRKELKTIMSQHREGGESDRDRVAFLSGPCGGCWSLRLTNQSAAVRSSACGSMPLNGLTEVELKNGYGNTEKEGSEWKNREREKER